LDSIDSKINFYVRFWLGNIAQKQRTRILYSVDRSCWNNLCK